MLVIFYVNSMLCFYFLLIFLLRKVVFGDKSFIRNLLFYFESLKLGIGVVELVCCFYG